MVDRDCCCGILDGTSGTQETNETHATHKAKESTILSPCAILYVGCSDKG